MANIKIELDYPLTDGMSLTFKAPCDNTAVTGLKVYYPEVGESGTTTTSKTFTFKDAHLNTISALGNLFSEGATVVVVVDTNNSYAFIQNADTNGYLENKVTSVAKGGTGATTAKDAAKNLSVLPIVCSILEETSGTDNLDSTTTPLVLSELYITKPELYTILNSNYAYVITLFYSGIGMGNSRMQLAISYTTGKMAMRNYYGGSWSGWHTVLTETNFSYSGGTLNITTT